MSLFGSIRALTVLLTDTSKAEWHFKGVFQVRVQLHSHIACVGHLPGPSSFGLVITRRSDKSFVPTPLQEPEQAVANPEQKYGKAPIGVHFLPESESSD